MSENIPFKFRATTPLQRQRLRQRRALRLLRKVRAGRLPPITCEDEEWFVPSESAPTKLLYAVDPSTDAPSCICNDFFRHGEACKHVWAVRFELCLMSGQELPPLPAPYKAQYKRDWTAYRKALKNRLDNFRDMLSDLCEGLETSEVGRKGGRPRLPLSDMVFAMTYKVYCKQAGAPFEAMIRDAARLGYVGCVPCPNSLCNYFADPEVTPILENLITLSCLPIVDLERETTFAVDGSGFNRPLIRRTIDSKKLTEDTRHDWVQLVMICGTRTKIIPKVFVTEAYVREKQFLPDLVAATAKTFRVLKVLADSAFGTIDNYKVLERIRARPIIMFTKQAHSLQGGRLQRKMYTFYSYQREKFFEEYHERSIAESTFSMIKQNFLGSVRAKGKVATVNEMLCKVLCHNIWVVIKTAYELHVEDQFWPKDES